MTSFEIVDNPLDDETHSGNDQSGTFLTQHRGPRSRCLAPECLDAEEPSYMDCCECKHTGSQLPVLLSLDDGSVDIICAICRRSFLFLDDLAGVCSDEIPMVLTYHDTTVSNPIVGTEYDGYWHLTLRNVDGAA